MQALLQAVLSVFNCVKLLICCSKFIRSDLTFYVNFAIFLVFYAYFAINCKACVIFNSYFSNFYLFYFLFHCIFLFHHFHRSSSSSSFEGHPLQARHKQNWGRGFILLLPQTAALPGSDAGSDVIKPASSFVIQNRQTACSMWCPMYGAHC